MHNQIINLFACLKDNRLVNMFETIFYEMKLIVWMRVPTDSLTVVWYMLTSIVTTLKFPRLFLIHNAISALGTRFQIWAEW